MPGEDSYLELREIILPPHWTSLRFCNHTHTQQNEMGTQPAWALRPGCYLRVSVQAASWQHSLWQPQWQPWLGPHETEGAFNLRAHYIFAMLTIQSLSHPLPGKCAVPLEQSPLTPEDWLSRENHLPEEVVQELRAGKNSSPAQPAPSAAGKL